MLENAALRWPVLALLTLSLLLASCSEQKELFNGSWVLDKEGGDSPAEHPLEWCGLVIDMQSGTMRIYSSYYDAYGAPAGGVRRGRLSRIGNGGKTAEFVMEDTEAREIVSVNYVDGKVTLGNETEFRYLPSDLGETLSRLGHSWRLDIAETAAINGLDPAEVVGKGQPALEFDVFKGLIIYTLPPEEKDTDSFWVSGYTDGILKIRFASDCEEEISLEFGTGNTIRMVSAGFVVALERGR